MNDGQLASYYDDQKAKGAAAHYAKAGLGFASPGYASLSEREKQRCRGVRMHFSDLLHPVICAKASHAQNTLQPVRGCLSTSCRGGPSQGRGMSRGTGSDGQQGNVLNNRPPLYADSSSAPGAPWPTPPQGSPGMVSSRLCSAPEVHADLCSICKSSRHASVHRTSVSCSRPLRKASP